MVPWLQLYALSVLFFACGTKGLGYNIENLLVDQASQQAGFVDNQHAYDSGLFTPLEDLSALSELEFTRLEHPFFPQYGVRIKKTSFCDDTVKSYTGYIDIQARHLFFYFFESRNNPHKDDVILWINGGPGCASSLGLFMELGPCQINDGNGTKFNPHSWNSNANIFFLDQPIGVGFSYADYGETVSTTEEASKDTAAFIAIFFEHFTKFKGRAFHMTGESYGGRYLPVFASEVYDQNARLVEAGLTPVNLTSVAIGNGIIDFSAMVFSYFDMTCTDASIPPVLNIASCVRMKQALPRCQKWLKEACLDQFDTINCNAAYTFCNNELSNPFFTTGRNPYNIKEQCKGRPETLCYPVIKYIGDYLDRPHIRSLLGVDPSLISNFTFCSDRVGLAFVVSMDEVRPTQHYIAALLERGVDVLIYAGTLDWICNWKSNERWTLDLDWSGGKEFSAQSLREWSVDGKRVGLTRSAKGLTFATVENAGHMVPHDKPKEALALINRWIHREEL